MLRLEHFARGPGVLAVGVIVEIAPANGHDVNDSGQAEEEKKERAADRGRLEGVLGEEDLVETESGIA